MPYSHIAPNIMAVRGRIARACERAGRDPSSVTLIAVTKTHLPAAIAAAFDAGVRDFGENRVQEARGKIPQLRVQCPPAAWHLIGHLQRNKVPLALDLFDVIHSIDSERLARAISDRAVKPVRMYLQVNVSGEASKEGSPPDDVPALADLLGRLPNLELVGLMAVAPIVADPEDARPVFRRLRELRDAIGIGGLSMGMTGDFDVAIEEGATAVRVGRAIFGPRG